MRAVHIYRTEDVEDAAQEYMDSGGWFEAEILTSGHVSLTACRVTTYANDYPEPRDIARVIARNKEKIPEAMDKLVKQVSLR